jgi:hypothetical protein
MMGCGIKHGMCFAIATSAIDHTWILEHESVTKSGAESMVNFSNLTLVSKKTGKKKKKMQKAANFFSSFLLQWKYQVFKDCFGS